MKVPQTKSTVRLMGAAAAAAAILAASGTAHAAETARFLNAPVAEAAPAAKLAVQFDLRLRLPQGRGLAKLLLDAGVDREDAAEVARVAAGHLGDGAGGCDVQVSISKETNGRFRLVRATLSTEAARTVIERRGTELTIASDTRASRFPRLV